MAHEVYDLQTDWKNRIVTQGDAEEQQEGCVSFEQFARQPIKRRQQKDHYLLPRISDKHQLLPDLMNKRAKISNAAKQWEISQQTNMTNSFEIHKISPVQKQAILQNVRFAENAQTTFNIQPKGLKLSFRKRVIEPLTTTHPNNPSQKIGKNLSTPVFVNRDEAIISYSVMEPKQKATQGTYRKAERKLEPLCSKQPSFQYSQSSKRNY